MSAKTELAKRPTEIVAERVRERREALGWNQAELARRLDELDYKIDRSTINKLENGNRGVSVDDLFALSLVLMVPPASLVTPRKGAAQVAITPRTRFPATLVGAWLRGVVTLPASPGLDIREKVKPQLVARLTELLGRDVPPLQRALMKDALEESASRWADQIINPPEEGEDDGNRH
jgi:transcriptional regulator with XRE-family HTH domain